MEIERRFLVQNIDEKINLNEYEYKEIVQDYLNGVDSDFLGLSKELSR